MENMQQEEIRTGSMGLRILDGAAGVLDKICSVSKYLNAFALVMFFGMVGITFVDVFMRYIIKSPLKGVKDVVEVMLVLVVAFTIAHVYNTKKHITVDLIIGRLKGRAKEMMRFIVTLIMLVFIVIVLKQEFKFTADYFAAGKTHGVVAIVACYPFQAALTLGFLFMALMIVRDLLQHISEAISSGMKLWQWLIVVGVPLLFWVFMYFWMQPALWSLSKGMLGLIGIVLMFALMFAGVPTGFSMMIAGLAMISHIRGIDTGLFTVGNLIFTTTSSYTWSVVGFFTLMGMFCFFFKFGDDMFDCVQKFLGHVRGGLAVVTIAASALLGAVVGDNNSVVSTMSAIAYPQMKKYDYDDSLAAGAMAAGSSLGPLIPPSTGFIIFGSLTGVSVGRLFMGGVGPGVIMALGFIILILVMCRRDPALGPRGPKAGTAERLRSLPKALPIIILFIFVIGGIFFGIFTASEGGAIGCIGALIIGLILRRVRLRNFFDGLIQSGAILGMIFTILIGAQIFSTFISWCNLSSMIAEWFVAMNFTPMGFCAVCFVLMLIAGCFIDIMPLFFLCIPIFYPIAQTMGVDGVWFGVMLVTCIQTGVITPPFAATLFLMRGLTDIPIARIFRGVWPFVIVTVVLLVVLFLIPSLVTFLPSALY